VDQDKSVPSVLINADGSCLGNPGPGGWAVVLQAGGHEKVLSGADPQTTNNRMELTAAIQALAALKRPSKVTLRTDSRYVVDGITKWVAGWKKRGWKTAEKKEVANQDLWLALDAAAARHEVRWEWVRGHAGDAANERVDRLAREEATRVAAQVRK
jgi:ribonuclease HI